MSSINTFLQQIHSQAPALLQVGVDRAENYRNLASLSSLWGQEDGQGAWPGVSGSSDTVTLAYQKIGDKVVTDLAALTAGFLKEEPGLDEDYILAVIEGDRGREARVYLRSEFLAGFEGEEKKSLADQLAANPLLVLDGSQSWPETSGDPAVQKLAAKASDFLKTAGKTINSLNAAGYDPLRDFTASEKMQKALKLFLAAAEA